MILAARHTRAILAIFTLSAFAAPALLKADAVFGTIFSPNLDIRAASIKISCQGNTYEGRIGLDGDYSVFVQSEGECTMFLRLNEGVLKAVITSYDAPARYNFKIVSGPNGYELVRQ